MERMEPKSGVLQLKVPKSLETDANDNETTVLCVESVNRNSESAKLIEDDEKEIKATVLCVESANKNSKSVKLTAARQREIETAAVCMQSWWRMRSAESFYREHLRPVHKVVFVITLFIRILVITYLAVILSQVVSFLRNSALEATSTANSDSLEQSVLRELMTKDMAGFSNIVTCSVIIFAYVAAQAYSIYSLVPRISTRIKQVDKKNEKCGCLKEILRAVRKSKIYKLYKIYRYPFIPIGMQIFETTSQMLAFISYVSIIPTRVPLLIWAILLSLDNIITPWIMFHGGEDTIGKRTKWERVLPGLALVFSLSYAFVVPLFMISTWQSIFGNVREDRFGRPGLFQSTEYARNYLIGAGDSGISFGFNATQGLYRVVGEEVFMSSQLRLLAAYFPLVNVLFTLRNMENRYNTAKAKLFLQKQLLGHVAEYNTVHPEAINPEAMSIFGTA